MVCVSVTSTQHSRLNISNFKRPYLYIVSKSFCKLQPHSESLRIQAAFVHQIYRKDNLEPSGAYLIFNQLSLEIFLSSFLFCPKNLAMS